MDTMDSRDLYKRLCELERMEEDHKDDPAEFPALDDEEEEELKELRYMESSVPDFRHGAVLVAEADFAKYVEQEWHETNEEAQVCWPYNCINWDDAADEVRSDWGDAEYNGTTYLYRM
jgi:hypothetical protein